MRVVPLDTGHRRGVDAARVLLGQARSIEVLSADLARRCRRLHARIVPRAAAPVAANRPVAFAGNDTSGEVFR